MLMQLNTKLEPLEQVQQQSKELYILYYLL